MVLVGTVLSMVAAGIFFISLSYIVDAFMKTTILKERRFRNVGITGTEFLDYFESITLDLVKKDRPSITSYLGHPIRVSAIHDCFNDFMFVKSQKGSLVRTKSVVAILTKDVTPVPVHSHNDYWRQLPLFDAIAHGAVSVEADVWNIRIPQKGKKYGELDNSQEYSLAVGHNDNYLDHEYLNLESLYTAPLLNMLNEVNVEHDGNGKKNGIFFDAPEQTLFFYIDFKSDYNKLTYRLLMEKYLQGLREKEYLTYYDLEQDKIVWNQVTVILTGNYPKDLGVLDGGQDKRGYFKDAKRYVFLDALMHDLSSSVIDNSTSRCV